MAMMRRAKLYTALEAVRRAFEQQEEELLTAVEMIDILSNSGAQIPTHKMLTLAADLAIEGHPLAQMLPRWPDGDDDEEDRQWAIAAQHKLKKYLSECLVGLSGQAAEYKSKARR